MNRKLILSVLVSTAFLFSPITYANDEPLAAGIENIYPVADFKAMSPYSGDTGHKPAEQDYGTKTLTSVEPIAEAECISCHAKSAKSDQSHMKRLISIAGHTDFRYRC